MVNEQRETRQFETDNDFLSCTTFEQPTKVTYQNCLFIPIELTIRDYDRSIIFSFTHTAPRNAPNEIHETKETGIGLEFIGIWGYAYLFLIVSSLFLYP